MRPISLVITIGDPAGCGPFITVKAVEELLNEQLCRAVNFIVVGDKKIVGRLPCADVFFKNVNFVDIGTEGINKIKAGFASVTAGRAALNYLDTGLKIAKLEKCALVTAPVSKESIGSVIEGFSGHTEYLADYFGVKRVEMMMVSGKAKIVLYTRHVALKKVPLLIKKDVLRGTINLAYSSLKGLFGIKKPKIALASVNPHAGIGTFLGKEEKIMLAAIKASRKNVSGPLPPDTLFTIDNIAKYDCLIASYHDQGMIPFKLLSFKEGVNLTLGLPIIRTSPAHGTAYDIMRAGKVPFWSSMKEAIKLAIELKK